MFFLFTILPWQKTDMGSCKQMLIGCVPRSEINQSKGREREKVEPSFCIELWIYNTFMYILGTRELAGVNIRAKIWTHHTDTLYGNKQKKKK